MTIISFENFTFKYNGVKSPTLKNINLNIEKGEKILIAGPSGSGKSTLAHCINGLIPFSYKGVIDGELTINGLKPYRESIHEISKHVGTILQDQDGQFVGLSVGEDVAFIYENNKVAQKDMFNGVIKALEAVNMNDYIDETPYNLSGGQKQRVSMAGILASDAEILLFDEPLANLDPVSGNRAMELIDEIHRRTNKTIIIIEHRIEDVLEHNIDRMVIIDEGEIIANSSPDELLSTNSITRSGLREPLYVEALKKLKVRIGKLDKISKIENAIKYSENMKKLSLTKKDIKEKEDKEIILQLEGVYYRYFKDSENIIKNISFNINKKETLIILGNNGAGKSTLLKVISGIARNNKGKMYYKGQNITDWTVRKRAHIIGYAMQNPNHMITQNIVCDEVAFGPRNFGMDKDTIGDRVNETLRICGLYEYRNWPISALSYGQKKRLTIASILVMKPEIIILDEPTAGQDYRNYKEFMTFLDRIKKGGTSIIIITHDMQLALEYGDRGLVLCQGEIIKEDSIYNILSDNEVIKKANLKETSLTKLARICGINNIGSFVSQFIGKEKVGVVNE